MTSLRRSLSLTSAALLLAGMLAGCQSVPVDENGFELSGARLAAATAEAPAPKMTPDVERVMRQVFAYDASIPVSSAFEQYGACDPKTRVWEELEPGDVQFSCRYDDGSIVQFDFRVDAAKSVRLAMVTFTTMNDAEFAGVSLRGPDAADMLKRIYMNQPLF
ncbi:hypothetical protein [uncultured Sutterella sp.]|uniref:hypothetical protein n=1 Tax=uncultured Sutterella sp. TaxID=286133 RepID=UPI0025EBDCE2|nr:hypothetical protein [uncultured Sutterella sp.]